MDDHQKTIAMTCLEAAEAGTMSFENIVAALIEAGFESYAIDFRRATATYFLADGDSVELPTHPVNASIAPAFDSAQMRSAIHEAQQQIPGYTYGGFCEKAALAGCASYVVSFLGRRAVYVGRTAETHTEKFPDR